MKKLYALSFLTALFLNSFSQTYYQLIRPNTTWDVMHPGPSICNLVGGDRYFFDGDTVIANIQYKIVRSHPIVSINPGPYCPPYAANIGISSIISFMREDTVNKKVYIFDEGNNVDDLLYDFTLTAGDTLHSLYAGGGIKPVVDSVGTIMLLNGDIRKIFYLNTLLTGVNRSYIESIGVRTDYGCQCLALSLLDV